MSSWLIQALGQKCRSHLTAASLPTEEADGKEEQTMSEILNATSEIKSLVFAAVSVAQNTEGEDPQEVSLTLALLQQQITARCEAIDEACRTSPPTREKGGKKK